MPRRTAPGCGTGTWRCAETGLQEHKRQQHTGTIAKNTVTTHRAQAEHLVDEQDRRGQDRHDDKGRRRAPATDRTRLGASEVRHRRAGVEGPGRRAPGNITMSGTQAAASRSSTAGLLPEPSLQRRHEVRREPGPERGPPANIHQQRVRSGPLSGAHFIATWPALHQPWQQTIAATHVRPQTLPRTASQRSDQCRTLNGAKHRDGQAPQPHPFAAGWRTVSPRHSWKRDED